MESLSIIIRTSPRPPQDKSASFNYSGATVSELVLRRGSVQKGTGPVWWSVMALERGRLSVYILTSQVGFLPFTLIFSLAYLTQLVFKAFYSF